MFASYLLQNFGKQIRLASFVINLLLTPVATSRGSVFPFESVDSPEPYSAATIHVASMYVYTPESTTA
jgi:hypothetical protein